MKNKMTKIMMMLAMSVFLTMTAQAAITVTNTDDSGAGSLRQAVADAVAGDTINFDSNVTGTITLLSGQINIDKDLTIQGPGARVLAVSGNDASRIFFVTSNNATINALTLRNGNADWGGAVNFNNYSGGTAFNMNAVTVRNSSASNGGGGMLLAGITTATITNCTISGNTAALAGGGLQFQDGTFTVENSTISGNTASFGGGGIFITGGIINLNSSTITNNIAPQNFVPGGGIYNFAAAIYISNTIVAGNTNANSPDVSGNFNSLGYNLIGINDGSSGFTAGSPNAGSDYVGTSASPINPMLGILQDNGGPTDTHALLLGSIAIDAGNSLLTTDQRGLTRPADEPTSPNGTGNLSDIGAFEIQSSTPNSMPNNKDQCKNGGWMTFTSPRVFKNQGDCIQFVNTGK